VILSFHVIHISCFRRPFYFPFYTIYTIIFFYQGSGYRSLCACLLVCLDWGGHEYCCGCLKPTMRWLCYEVMEGWDGMGWDGMGLLCDMIFVGLAGWLVDL